MFNPRNYLVGTFIWMLLLWGGCHANSQERPSAREQAFSTRILTEVNANLTCTAELIALQERLAKAEAELKKLQEAPRP